MDSDSTDRTAEVATRAGATVHRSRDVAEAWARTRARARRCGSPCWSRPVTSWCSWTRISPGGARISSPGCSGRCWIPPSRRCWSRPATTGAVDGPVGGGRVTELVARPLLNLWWPELAVVAQPLAGEWAASRSLLETLPFRSGTASSWPCSSTPRGDTGPVRSPRSTWESARTGTSQTRTSRSWRPNCCSSPSEGACPAPMSGARAGEQRPAGLELRQFIREDGALRARPRAVPCAERPPVSSLTPSVAQ